MEGGGKIIEDVVSAKMKASITSLPMLADVRREANGY